VDLLANDKPLAAKHHDHPLGGNWKAHWECHMKPDLLLVYKLPDQDTLRLVRMGSHSELFSK
jgi:mRNA interferase YafQ